MSADGVPFAGHGARALAYESMVSVEAGHGWKMRSRLRPRHGHLDEIAKTRTGQCATTSSSRAKRTCARVVRQRDADALTMVFLSTSASHAGQWPLRVLDSSRSSRPVCIAKSE